MTAQEQHFDVASFGRPCDGESVSGDTAVWVRRTSGIFLALVDAMGHGPPAHGAATKAMSLLADIADADLTEVMRRLHEELRGGRGAAVGCAFLETDSGRLRYVGIGNVRARVLGAVDMRLVGRDGVVGQNWRTPREHEARMRPGDLLVLTSDGVSERWGFDDYPALAVDSPDRIARTMVSRWGKSHDDATCLALRFRPGALP